jgi:hypothetical protein
MILTFSTSSYGGQALWLQTKIPKKTLLPTNFLDFALVS